MSALVVSGAYGRQYTSEKAVLADWQGGKDFIIRSIGPWMGSYMSIRDVVQLKRDGYKWVNIRYNKDADVTVIAL